MDKSWIPAFNLLSDAEKKIVNEKLVNVIRYDPYDSEALRWKLDGLYSYNKIESGIRIVFAICYECRKGGFVKVNNCTDCESIQTNVVKLFVVGPHSIYDEIDRERGKRLRFKK